MGFFARKKHQAPITAPAAVETTGVVDPARILAEESPLPSDDPAQATSSPALADEQQNDEEVYEEVDDAQEWDEGGPSHCGYHETVHATLMTVGASVHSLVGDPPEGMQSSMKQVGNWFQEASYATRDFIRGDQEVNDDAGDTLSTMKNNLTEFVTGSPTNARDVTSEEKKTNDFSDKLQPNGMRTNVVRDKTSH